MQEKAEETDAPRSEQEKISKTTSFKRMAKAAGVLSSRHSKIFGRNTDDVMQLDKQLSIPEEGVTTTGFDVVDGETMKLNARRRGTLAPSIASAQLQAAGMLGGVEEEEFDSRPSP